MTSQQPLEFDPAPVRVPTPVPPPPTPCLIWTGSISRYGYGVLVIDYKQYRVHRLVWEKTNGPIPAGMYIDHMCRNRACHEVTHLRLVTPRQNAIENNVSIAAINAVKVACHRGHPLSPKPRNANGNRYCKRCNAERALAKARAAGRQPFTRIESCWRGHAFTDANTRWKRDGTRNCRQCERERGIARRLRDHDPVTGRFVYELVR